MAEGKRRIGTGEGLAGGGEVLSSVRKHEISRHRSGCTL